MERIVVCLAFILIFAFNSVDNAISPIVQALSSDFGVSSERALLFISVCTGGTVVGLIFGPSLVASLKINKLLGWCAAILALSQLSFALSSSFELAMVLRAISGLTAGFIASVMWHLTFHGVSKAYFPAMIAVLMSARPLATALGVPAAGLLTDTYNWHLPITIIAFFTGLSGLALARLYPQPHNGKTTFQNSPNEGASKETASTEESNPAANKAVQTQNDRDESPATQAITSKNALSILKKIIDPYIKALSVPLAVPYYIGSTINRMAYFGFYSFCGLWFPYHYGLDLKEISFALLIIGLADCLINFATNSIIKKFGHKFTFLTSIILSLLILPIFIYGKLPISWAIAAIAIFMTLDRIYSMALVISVPDMFPSVGDKTAFGSLNTLTAWGAMSIIAAIQGFLTEKLGLGSMETLLIACFIVGGLAITYVQSRTVFGKAVLECNKK